MYLPAKGVRGLTVGGINMKGSSSTTNGARKRANALSGGEWLRHSFSIWRNLGKGGEERRIDHPAIFTVKLVSRLLDAYTTCNGETVLDPFAGSGTTLVAALEKNMSAVGIDINKKFRDEFVKRTLSLFPARKWKYHVCDAHKMGKVVQPASIDICITSPPYWNILTKRRSADGGDARPYSAMKNDLGNMKSYEDFLAALGEISGEIRKAIRPGGTFILNVMDLRQKSKFYPLHMDATTVVTECGFSLDDIIVWDRQDEYNNMRPLGYPYKFIINKVHEYLLVFRA